MSKLSQKAKDEFPYVYGYSKPSLIPGNEECGLNIINGEPVYVNFKVPFTWFIDADGHKRFVECSAEFANWNRNEMRNEERKIDNDSRCKIPAYLIEVNGVFVTDKESKRANREFLKICTHKDCKSCPYKFDPNHPDRQVDYERTGNAYSMNQTFTNDEGDEEEREYEDTKGVSPSEFTERNMQEEALWNCVNQFDEDAQKIINLLYKGKSYSQIALIMGKSKSAVQEKGQRLIGVLKEKLKNF